MKLPLQPVLGDIRIPDYNAMTVEGWDAVLGVAWAEYDQALEKIENDTTPATAGNTFLALERGDRTGDVEQVAYSPEPPPCGTVTQSDTSPCRSNRPDDISS